MKRLLFAILVLAPLASPAADAPAEPAMALSPYEVRANSVEFKHWIKVGSPNFILYTDASASEASQTLREFEMLHFASQIVFGRKAAYYGPTILVLPTAGSDWRKLETKGGNEEWKSATGKFGGAVADEVVVQYDWQDQGLGLVRAAYSFVDMDRMSIVGPFWLSRGFGIFYETADFDGDRVNLGHVSPRVWELKDRSWLPWDRFFNVNPQSPEFIKEDKVRVYEAQASIFTQFLFANPDRAWVDRLVAWIDYLRAGGAPTEAQFASIFGQDWKSWQRTMENYLSSGRYSVYLIKAADAVRYQEVKYKLPVKEMRELFILTQTLVQRVPESRASLDALLQSGLQSDSLRELLLESCLDWGRRDAALKIVRQLIADGTKNPRVYREGDALLTSYAGPLSLDCRYGSELPEVRAWDRRGLELEPLYVDLANSFASNEACAPVVDQQSITTIEDCYRRIRGRAPTDKVITALAMALWRAGQTDAATQIATRLKDDPLAGKRYRAIAAELLKRMAKPVEH